MGVQPAKGGLLKVAKSWTAAITSVCVLAGFTATDGPIRALPQGRQPSLWTMPLKPGQWTNIGPNPMRVTGTQTTQAGSVVALDYASKSQTLYAATDAGGIWAKPKNKPWIPLTDSQSNLWMLSVAVDPNHNDVVYAGAQNGAGDCLYKSEDSGKTWSVRVVGCAVLQVKVDPKDSNRVYLATDAGFMVSSDAGKTWTTTNHSYMNDLEVAGDGSVYAVDNRGSLSVSTDHGQGWKQLFQGQATDATARLAIAPSTKNLDRSQQVIWVAAGSHHLGHLYRYANGELSTWNPDPSLPNQGNCWHNLTLAGDPDNPQAVYLGINLLFHISASAETPARVSHLDAAPLKVRQLGGDSYHSDLHAILMTPEGMIIGNDGGVHLSANRGKSFKAYNQGLADTEFFSGAVNQAGTVVLAGSQDNGVDRAVVGKGRVTWDEVIGGDGIDVAFNQRDQSQTLATVFSAPVVASRDSGETWSPSSVQQDTFSKGLYAGPSGTMYYTNQYLWRTLDLKTWTKLSTPSEFQGSRFVSLAIAPGNPDLLYATNGASVVRSNDGGVSWTSVKQRQDADPAYVQVGVDPHNPEVVYVLDWYGLDVTINGGKDWTTTKLPLADVDYVETMAVGTRDVVVATTQGVYRTVDRGKSWTQVGKGLPQVYVTALVESPDGKRDIAFTYGRSAWIVEG